MYNANVLSFQNKSMKKKYIVAIIIFIILTICSFATYADETPLEQNIFIGYLALIGFATTIPITILTYPILSLPSLVYNQNIFHLYLTIFPFIVGLFYAGFYLLIVYAIRKNKSPVNNIDFAPQ
jgi:hypothetical protein